METDREILLWFHERLVRVHKESEIVDYMHRLRWIILATNPKQISRGQSVKQTCNSFDELGKLIKNKSNVEKNWFRQSAEEKEER